MHTPEITKIRTSCGRPHLESLEETMGGASYYGKKLQSRAWSSLVRGHLGIASTHPAPPPQATWGPSSHHLLDYMENHDCLLSPMAEKKVGPMVTHQVSTQTS